MRIAFITSSNFNLIPEGEKNCLDNLSPRINYEPVIWDQVDPSELAQYDKILIRTCWDYHLKFTEFNLWLDELEKRSFSVTNPIKSIRWNSQKSYLFDLAKANLPITPTYSTSNISIMLSDFPDCKSFVVKPLVSATSYQLKKISRENLSDDAYESPSIVQPFLPEIQTNGEWSLVFFKGHYSHAALKRAKDGDFRVQSDFGGSVHYQVPSGDLISVAQKVIDVLPVPMDYCRIDLLNTAKGCMIMEVELIEPELFIQSLEAQKNYTEFVKSLANI